MKALKRILFVLGCLCHPICYGQISLQNIKRDWHNKEIVATCLWDSAGNTNYLLPFLNYYTKHLKQGETENNDGV